MASYQILENNQGDEKIVKTGFSWPAFFFTEFWAISKGLWPHGLLCLLLDIISFVIISNVYDYYPVAFFQNVVWFIIKIYFGIKGNDWVLVNLKNKKYKIRDKSENIKSEYNSIPKYDSEWICEKCGASNVKGALVCYSCASQKMERATKKIYYIRMEAIAIKIKSVKDLKKMAISLDEKEDSKIIETHNKIIAYLESYYEKYCEICYSNDVEELSEKYLQQYETDKDLNNLYKNLLNSISKCYEKYINDNTLTDKKYLEVKKRQYEEKIKAILKNAIIDKTNNVINNISPIDDKFDLTGIIKKSLSCDVDIIKLNEAYDKFESEVTIA